MAFNIKKHILVWAFACCFLCFMPFSYLSAQSSQLSISSSLIAQNDSAENDLLKNVDGPYFFRNKKGGKLIQFVKGGNEYMIIEKDIDLKKTNEFKCVVDNKEADSFTFQLKKKIRIPKSTYSQPEKLLAISDIEGNFNAFHSLLLNNGVIDENYNWTYGKGHLVLGGDFMDRGENVTQVLWLIYKLEQEAQEQGGMVHFILGNHEVMNLQGIFNYVDKKYVQLAQKYSGETDKKAACSSLMTKNQELVKWLKSKNSIEKIGNLLFVHGGISPELVNAKFSINEINEIIRSRLLYGPSIEDHRKQNEDFLFASFGPLWYRGLAINYRNHYKKSTEKEVEKALKTFRVKHIVIGHTIANEISTDFNGKVIRTDVKHGIEKNSPYSQALLVEHKQFYRVDGKGEKVPLFDETDQSSN
jgi:hypothetical protein